MPHDTHLTARQLTARYSICRRTVGRWTESPTLDFPKPIVINKRRYWREAEIKAWEATRAAI